MERTFAIIKPDAVAAGHAGEIIAIDSEGRLPLAGMKMKRLSQLEAEGFYAVHNANGRFIGSLVKFMTEGPVVVMVLEAPGRHQEVARHDGRDQSGQRRRRHHPQAVRDRIERNCVHGSDAPETASGRDPFFL